MGKKQQDPEQLMKAYNKSAICSFLFSLVICLEGLTRGDTNIFFIIALIASSISGMKSEKKKLTIAAIIISVISIIRMFALKF